MTLDQRLAIVILAAGSGSRMGGGPPKPLVEIAGAPMVRWVLDAAAGLNPQRILCVIPPANPALARELRPLELVVQFVPDGPGGALRATEPSLRGFSGDILVLPADAPMVDEPLLRAVIAARRGRDAPPIAVCGAHLKEPTGYGRLRLDEDGRLLSIVEERDTTPAERSISLCNLGPMVIEAESLWPRLAALTKENAAGEYLTTDMIAAASSGGEPCACVVSKAGPVLSVNTAAQRDEVDHLMRGRAPPRWRARRYRTIREAIRTARADLVDPRKGYGVVRSVLSEVEVTAFQARRGAELESLPSGSSRINNDRMFDYIHRRSHDRVHRTTRIYKFFHNAEADELILYRRVLKIRRALESTWWRDSTYRDISNAQHVFNIVTTYDQDTGMLPRHRDFHGPDTFPLLQCLIPLSAKGVDYEGGDFLLVTAAGDVISAENDLKLRRGDLLLFEKSLEHEIGRTRRGPTGLGRWTLLVGVRAPPREEAS